MTGVTQHALDCLGAEEGDRRPDLTRDALVRTLSRTNGSFADDRGAEHTRGFSKEHVFVRQSDDQPTSASMNYERPRGDGFGVLNDAGIRLSGRSLCGHSPQA